MKRSAELKKSSRQLGREIERRAEEILPTLGNRLNDIESSDLYKETLRNINSKRQSRDWSGAFRVAAEGVERLAGLAGKFSAGDAHRAILNIGHLFGYTDSALGKPSKWLGS